MVMEEEAFSNPSSRISRTGLPGEDKALSLNL